MKWFKHFANAHDDEKLVEVLEQYGLEGIGFWWIVCEIVAAQMDDSDKCEASYPIPAWSRKLTISVRKTTALFTKFSEINLIFMEYDDSNGVGKLKIKIPKLLEFRDNYSKKRRTMDVQTTSCVRRKEVEVEVEEKKKIKSLKPLSEYSDEFESFWAQYPNKTGKGAAFKSWQKMKPPLFEVINALLWQKNSQQWIDGFIPHPATYLNQRRWHDEPVERRATPRPVTFEEQKMINTKQGMIDFVKEAPDARHERKQNEICSFNGEDGRFIQG